MKKKKTRFQNLKRERLKERKREEEGEICFLSTWEKTHARFLITLVFSYQKHVANILTLTAFAVLDLKIKIKLQTVLLSFSLVILASSLD